MKRKALAALRRAWSWYAQALRENDQGRNIPAEQSATQVRHTDPTWREADKRASRRVLWLTALGIGCFALLAYAPYYGGAFLACVITGYVTWKLLLFVVRGVAHAWYSERQRSGAR